MNIVSPLTIAFKILSLLQNEWRSKIKVIISKNEFESDMKCYEIPDVHKWNIIGGHPDCAARDLNKLSQRKIKATMSWRFLLFSLLSFNIVHVQWIISYQIINLIKLKPWFWFKRHNVLVSSSCILKWKNIILSVPMCYSEHHNANKILF